VHNDLSYLVEGIFISIEGIDGAGKTTLAQSLKQFFEKEHYKVVSVREPGGTDVSEKIRSILLDTGLDISYEAETLLYATSRVELVSRVIKPSLLQGCAVISDRYHDSTIAYQGYGRQLEVSWVVHIAGLSTLGVVPNITFLLDGDCEKLLVRKSTVQDKFDSLDLDFFRRVRQGYLEIAEGKFHESDCRRIVLIDATLELETIIEKATNYLKAFLDRMRIR
jgi:dTMP kinase